MQLPPGVHKDLSDLYRSMSQVWDSISGESQVEQKWHAFVCNKLAMARIRSVADSYTMTRVVGALENHRRIASAFRHLKSETWTQLKDR